MKTIAFYSYKGGTSRSLLLANFARFLAKGNQSVVVLDFDLEAPGLHHKFLESRNLSNDEWENKRETAGLQEFLKVYEASSKVPELREAPQDLKKYFMKLHFKDCKKACYFMPEGNAPTIGYASKHLARNWKEYFPNRQGEEPFGLNLFLNLRNRIKDELDADFLLIDERTGLTDIGANSLLFVPNTAVCLFLSNTESLVGTRLMLETIHDVNTKPGMSLAVVPVLTRIPNDKAKRNAAIRRSKEVLGDLCDLEKLSVLHEEMSLHVIEEILFGSSKSLRESVLLRDYIEFFKHLEPGILEISEVAALDKYLPSWKNINEREDYHGADSSGQAEIGISDKVSKTQEMSYVPVYFHTGVKLRLLVQAMANNLAQSIIHKDANRVPEDKVNWNYLANQMQSGNYAFCGEPYYLTRFRGLSSGVVKIGEVETFTCFVSRDSQAGIEFSCSLNEWNKDENHSKGERIREEGMVGIIGTLKNKCQGKLRIGTMGETPAGDVLSKRLASIICGERLEFKPNEGALWSWLNENNGKQDNADAKIVICDHVVASKLLSLAGGEDRKSEYIFYDSSVEDGPRFEYDEPIPVGFMYPIDDVLWRRRISNSLADVLYPHDSESYSHNWAEIKNELQHDCVTVLEERELCKELIWDMELDEAISWDKRLPNDLEERIGKALLKGE